MVARKARTKKTDRGQSTPSSVTDRAGKTRIVWSGHRVAGKLSNGEGSVYVEPVYGRPDPSSGERFVIGECWRATYYVNGRVRRVQAKTRLVAIERRTAAIAKVEAQARLAPVISGRFSPDTTLGGLADYWLENVVRHEVRATTLREYGTKVKRFDALASVRVVDVTIEGVQRWQSELLNRGLAPNTVKRTKMVLGLVMAQAVTLGFRADNPVKGVKPPQIPSPDKYALDRDEIRRLIAHCDGNRYGAVVHMLFVQGWRISEVLGLAWADIDVVKGSAFLRRAVHDVPGVGLALGEPKTKSTKGERPLTAGTVERLRRRRVEQAAERLAAPGPWPVHSYDGQAVDLIFTTDVGGIVRRQTIDTLLRRSAEVLGLDASRLGTHAGRRSVITLLRNEGIPTDDIALHTGQDPKTTAGYIVGTGNRAQLTADRAGRLLDVPVKVSGEN